MLAVKVNVMDSNITTKFKNAFVANKEFIKALNKDNAIKYSEKSNKFEGISSQDDAVLLSSHLKLIAVSIIKISNDLRWMNSGPGSGISDITLKSLQPGSSIMPGKVNPTQCEALCMAALQVIASDQAVSMAASQGHLELNVNKPLIAYNIHHSIHLLADSITSFCNFCLEGLTANTTIIQKHVENSLMLVTALTPEIGYDKASEIANLAYREHLSLREAAKQLGTIALDVFDKLIDPKKMV